MYVHVGESLKEEVEKSKNKLTDFTSIASHLGNQKVTGSIPVRDSKVFLRLGLIGTRIQNYNKLTDVQVHLLVEITIMKCCLSYNLAAESHLLFERNWEMDCIVFCNKIYYRICKMTFCLGKNQTKSVYT